MKLESIVARVQPLISAGYCEKWFGQPVHGTIAVGEPTDNSMDYNFVVIIPTKFNIKDLSLIHI